MQFIYRLQKQPEQYLTESCKVCLLHRKDAFACYLVLSRVVNSHMTMLDTVQRVHEHVPIDTTFPPKTTVHTNPLFNELKGGGGGGVQAYYFGNFQYEIRVEGEGQDTPRLF